MEDKAKFTLPFESIKKEEVLEDRIIIPFDKKIVILYLPDFDFSDVDVEDFMKIDYSNLIGELITFPVLLNRVGLMKAEMEEIAKVKKFEAQVYEAELKNHYRKALTFRGADEQKKKPTAPEVDGAVLVDKGYQVVMKNLFRTEKGLSQVESIFWSAKDKSDKLNKIAEKLHPKEFENEIVEGTVNGILIKVKKSKV